MKKYTIKDLETNEDLYVNCPTEEHWSLLKNLCKNGISTFDYHGNYNYNFHNGHYAFDKFGRTISFEQVIMPDNIELIWTPNLTSVKKDKEFVLPEKWAVKITKENREVLKKWVESRHDFKFDCLLEEPSYLKIGYYVANNHFDKTYQIWIKNLGSNSSTKEITFEQFKKYVLKEEPMETLPEEYIVECSNAEETTIVMTILANYKGYEWEHWSYVYNVNSYIENEDRVQDKINDDVKHLPIIKFKDWYKLINKTNTMEKEIIGYKLKKECEQYRESALKIIPNSNYLKNNKEFDYIFEDCATTSDLKKAGVLDLWFEPIYKEKEKFKVGDWVYADYSGNGDFRRDAGHDNYIPTFQIKEINDEFLRPEKGEGYGISETYCRMATKAEIDAELNPMHNKYMYKHIGYILSSPEYASMIYDISNINNFEMLKKYKSLNKDVQSRWESSIDKIRELDLIDTFFIKSYELFNMGDYVIDIHTGEIGEITAIYNNSVQNAFNHIRIADNKHHKHIDNYKKYSLTNLDKDILKKAKDKYNINDTYIYNNTIYNIEGTYSIAYTSEKELKILDNQTNVIYSNHKWVDIVPSIVINHNRIYITKFYIKIGDIEISKQAFYDIYNLYKSMDSNGNLESITISGYTFTINNILTILTELDKSQLNIF